MTYATARIKAEDNDVPGNVLNHFRCLFDPMGLIPISHIDTCSSAGDVPLPASAGCSSATTPTSCEIMEIYNSGN